MITTTLTWIAMFNYNACIWNDETHALVEKCYEKRFSLNGWTIIRLITRIHLPNNLIRSILSFSTKRNESNIIWWYDYSTHQNAYFIQYGAHSHCTVQVRNYLRETYAINLDEVILCHNPPFTRLKYARFLHILLSETLCLL